MIVAAAGGGWWGPTLAVGMLAAGVGLFTLAVNQIQARKDRQRVLFEDAFAALTEYREYPFIVRRRAADGSDRQAIATALSGVQARLNQYAARLLVEAPRVGRAYRQLVADTRRVAGAEISRSWARDVIPLDGPMDVRDVDLSELDMSDAVFLREVDDQLALVPARGRRAVRATWQRVRRTGRRTARWREAPRVEAAETRQ